MIQHPVNNLGATGSIDLGRVDPMRRRPSVRRNGPGIVLALGILATVAEASDPAADAFFENQVRPILVKRCGECHGATGKAKGGLRLASREDVLKGGDSGPAAVPGHPDESLLIAAVRYVDEPRMPPKGKLPDPEIDVLAGWVARGLPWPAQAATAAATPSGKAWTITPEQRKHWAYQPVRDPAPPKVADESWPKSSIDRFVLAGLERKGIGPAPAADRRTLIRRATFDLTGLPPSPEEVARFEGDDSPDAFAGAVDRLLASPRYGERWGRHWLDLVRYADSRDARGVGGSDDITEAYRYRDWVVAAFNADIPYDKFVVDQVAGDLVPASGPDGFNAEGMVATGLLTIGEWGTGDADKEKMMTDIVADQVDVVSRAFLGLTIACARCHDHKFDPISHADYYGLAGIFFSTHILPDPGPKTAGSPMLRTPIAPPSTVEAAARHKARLAELERKLTATAEAEAVAAARAALPRVGDHLRAAAEVAGDVDGTATVEAMAASHKVEPAALRRWLDYLGLAGEGTLLGRPVASMLGAKGVDCWIGPTDAPPWVGVNRNDGPVTLLTFVLPAQSVDLHPGPSEPAAVAWTSPIGGEVRVRGRVADADDKGGNGVAWSLDRRRGRAWKALASGEIPNGGKAEIAPVAVEVEPGDGLRLVVFPKGEYSFDTTTIELKIDPVDGRPGWDLGADLLPDLHLGGRGNPHPDRTGRPEVWRFLKLDPTSRARRADPKSMLADWSKAVDAGDEDGVSAAIRAIEARLNGPDGKGLVDELTSPSGPLRPAPAKLSPDATARLAGLRAEIDALKASPPPPIPLALVAREGGVPRSVYEGFHDARIQIRGEYARLGPVVPRRFPTILAGDEPPKIGPGSGRLELARWIARPDNPLTARVMVNRIWAFHFGEGIVRTPSNFGKLGEPPNDPDLLDHLAREFVASGWSIKAMHRRIMNSAAYRQASAVAAEARRADPENRRFGRMNRRRLESEPIRDSLLAVSGRLDPAMGGPAYRDFNVPRRTLYLMTIRSDRSSFGPMFDAADATAIVDTRVVSTVAPQALFLLNNPFAIEAARAFSERVRRESDTTDGRIDRAYRLAYGRPPADDELAVGRDLVGRGDDPARWAAFGHVLLCANEFFFVD